jgi:hypothetical protein
MTRAAASFSDQQIRMLRQAARQLPVALRGDFLLSVARSLSGLPSDAAVQAAIN